MNQESLAPKGLNEASPLLPAVICVVKGSFTDESDLYQDGTAQFYILRKWEIMVNFRAYVFSYS